MSGNRNKRYLPTNTALAWLTAMNRQSSNRVKMSKMATRAMKLTRKLTANVRNRLASIKFGNPQLPIPLVRPCQVLTAGCLELVGARFITRRRDSSGMRLIARSHRLRHSINAVAIQGPTMGEIVPARERDSPKSEDR